MSLCERARAADTHEASSARTHPERGGQILSSRFVLWVPHFMPGGATTMPVVDHAGKIIFYAVWRVVKASENALGSSNWWPSPAPPGAPAVVAAMNETAESKVVFEHFLPSSLPPPSLPY